MSRYLSDQSTDKDQLDFEAFRDALQEVVETAETPLTVGVFGPWGSGKTSLMRMVRKQVEDKGLARVRTVWFTAWKYDRQEALWRALILRVLDALYPRVPEEKQTSYEKELVQLLERLEESVYQTVEWEELGDREVNLLRLFGHSSKAAIRVVASLVPGGIYSQLKEEFGDDETVVENIKEAARAISKQTQQRKRQQLVHMEQFEDTFAKAVRLIDRSEKTTDISKDRDWEPEGRLIVFVDDLDRCLPEKGIEVLEAIKLFLEVPGVVFVLGMDQGVVRKGIEARYGSVFHQVVDERSELPIRGDSYLQKIVQIPFYLPAMAVDDLKGFIADLNKELSDMTLEVLARGLYPNPRQVKRVLNIFRLLRTIADNRFQDDKDTITDPLLAKTVIIQTQYPELYQLWRQYPTVVQTLEAEYGRRTTSEDEVFLGRRPRPVPQKVEGETEEPTGSTTFERDGGILAEFLNDPHKYARLARMLTHPADDKASEGKELARFASLGRKAVARYVRLAGAVETESSTTTPVELPAGFEAEFLSGDLAIIQDAAGRLEAEEGKEGPKRMALQTKLVPILENAQEPVERRLSAGDTLAVIGDPRPGVTFTIQNGEKIPDIAWGGVVPAGEYTIGGDVEIADNGFPEQKITIAQPYQLARFPVTHAQFQCFEEAADFRDSPWWRDMPEGAQEIDGAQFPLANRPRERVSWYQAIAFCRWLSTKLGREVDLPTEYEWEVAARYPDGRLYPWGNEFDPSNANTEEGGPGQTSPVGMYPAGRNEALRLYDLSGNVWEWCRNKHQAPEMITVDNSNDWRVVRGGSWRSAQYGARAADRGPDHPSSRGDSYGFRLVCRSPSQ